MIDTYSQPIKTSHSKSALTYAASMLFERMGHYGFRGVFVTILLSASIGMETGEAFTFYGTVTGLIYLSKIFGGVIGDLAIGSRVAILIGGGLQALGVLLLLLLFMPGSVGLYIGITLLIIGNGFYGPNLMAAFGREYINSPRIADSGFGILYMGINIGAFFSVISVTILGEFSLTYSLLAALLFYTIATLLALATEDKTKQEVSKPKPYQAASANVLLVILAILMSAVFWLVYEFAAPSITFATFSIEPDLLKDNTLDVYQLKSVVNFTTMLIFGGLLSVLWFYMYSSSVIKIAIGFLLAGVAIALIPLIPSMDANSAMYLILLHVAILGIGEFFLIGPAMSLLTKKGNPKYLAILMAVLSFTTFLLLKLFTTLTELFNMDMYSYDPNYLIVGILLFGFIGIAILIIHFVIKNVEPDLEKISNSEFE